MVTLYKHIIGPTGPEPFLYLDGHIGPTGPPGPSGPLGPRFEKSNNGDHQSHIG